MYKRQQIDNGLFLLDDRRGEWIGPCTPGTNGRLVNDIVQLECGASRIITDENHSLRVVWRVYWIETPDKKAEFNVYLRAVDRSGNDSQLVEFGTWPIPATHSYLPMVLK